jgi:hypothetical protein
MVVNGVRVRFSWAAKVTPTPFGHTRKAVISLPKHRHKSSLTSNCNLSVDGSRISPDQVT